MAASVSKVFADESGNTGEDLLSLDQPVFVVGSVCLTDEDANSILATAGLDGRREWKFSRLRRSNPGRRAIVSVLEALDSSSAKWAGVHKRFMISCKLVDELLEPVLKHAGIDLYDQSGQVVVANAWHESLPAVLGKTAADELLGSFVEMYRLRSPSTIDDFYRRLESAGRALEGPLGRDLEILIESRPFTERFLLGTSPDRDDLDPAQPFLFPLLSAWGEQLGTKYEVIHDQVTRADQWLQMMRPFLHSDLPRRTVGYGERTWVLPLWATGISFADSATIPHLQIADLVAGSANCWLRGIDDRLEDRSFHDALTRTGILELLVLAVWPEPGADLDEADAAQSFQLDPISQAAAFMREWEEAQDGAR